MKACAKNWPVPRAAEPQRPSSLVVVCGKFPALVHMTVSPVLMVRLLGWKARSTIVTVGVGWGVFVGVGVLVGVAVSVGVLVGVGVSVGMLVGAEVGVSVGVAVLVGVRVGVSVGVDV